MKKLHLTLLGATMLCATPSLAEEVNNGTNPTVLATKLTHQYEYTDLGSGFYVGLLENIYTMPFGDSNQFAIEVNVPFASGPIDNTLDLSDVSLKWLHVPYVTAKNGAAYTLEFFFDTAERPDIGSGQNRLEASAFYAWFLDNGAIFAPAVVHQFTLGDVDVGRNRVSQTTFDFYYVPKLPNPQFFMTLDPAVVHDWEADTTFGSFQLTMGMLTGKLFGGQSQIFVKPGVLFGPDRPADWSVQVGFKVIGF
jgi:hypothetical protein